MKILIIFVLFFFSQKLQAFGPVISNMTSEKIDELKLIEKFFKAQKLFEAEIGPLTADISISIQDRNCFRTGYDYVGKKVVFCNVKNVISFGLESDDIINHELFHAFLCSFNSSLCGKKLNKEAHEGMADYFAYLLNPDQYFGEKFYKGKDYIRNYQVNWKPGLVQGEHAIGNILASQLIRSSTSLKEGLIFFESNLIADEVEEEIVGFKKSSLNRYRLSLDDKFIVHLKFPNHPDVTQISWRYSEGISLEKTAPLSAAIKFKSAISATIVDAVFSNDAGEILGFRRYYFGVAL